MPSLPQSNNLQEIQRAFLERDAELRRLVGDTKTAAAASVTGLRKTISSSRGTSGSTTPSGGTTATIVKGRRVITAVSTEALSFYETNYTQAEFTESADIISIETNHPAWVRVYSSAAARLEDASRLFSQPPVAGTGLMVEVLTFLPDDLLIYLSPVPFWNNCDTVLGKTAYIAVTRWDNDDPEILEMTFTILPQEEMDKNGSQGLLGPRGFTGDGYQTMGEWSGTETYLANDVVGRNGSVYCSLLNDNLNQDPATATIYWTLWAAKGSKGDPGEDGAPGTPGAPGADGADGANGSDGAAATIAVGTVTSGETVSATNSGTPSAAVLDFVLQKGDTGAAGADGVDGVDGLTINWQGAYNAATTYAKNDGVSLNGSSFISKADSNTGNTPDPTQETAYWGILAKAGSSGSSGKLLQDIVQMGSTGTTTSKVTINAPTISEGMQIASVTITPSVVGSRIIVRAKVRGSLNAGYNGQHAALFKDGASANIAYSKMNMLTSGWPLENKILYVMTTTSLDAITFALRAGSETAGTWTAYADSWLEVQEIAA